MWKHSGLSAFLVFGVENAGGGGRDPHHQVGQFLIAPQFVLKDTSMLLKSSVIRTRRSSGFICTTYRGSGIFITSSVILSLLYKLCQCTFTVDIKPAQQKQLLNPFLATFGQDLRILFKHEILAIVYPDIVKILPFNVLTNRPRKLLSYKIPYCNQSFAFSDNYQVNQHRIMFGNESYCMMVFVNKSLGMN